MKLQAPFPYFGGKSRVAKVIWKRFGVVGNYVEPFFGSGAVLLGRPLPFDGKETVNDLDGMIANFWRAVQQDPEAVAEYADWPVNENDLTARHLWLVGRKDSLQARLECDPEHYDAKIAGWWCWGLCSWIGSGWCEGGGAWSAVGGELVKDGDAGRGVSRRRPHLGDAGHGVNRRKIQLTEWMETLSDRFRRVRVCCGDWSRVCGPIVTFKHGMTAVFLDPPYSAEADRDSKIYRMEDLDVAHAVRDWAVEQGEDKLMRICLAGYEGEHEMPKSWECFAWKAGGGYGSRGSKGEINAHRERLWFSPHCIKPVRHPSLFDVLEDDEDV